MRPSCTSCALLTVLLGVVGCASTVTPRPAATSPSPAPGVPAISTPVIAVAAPSPDPSPPVAAPTWSSLFEQYFAAGTEGGCARSKKCHASEMSDPESAFRWLQQRGYIDGTRSALVSRSNSCLRWFGGNMPPSSASPGAANEQAAADLAAWVAAGAHDD